VLRPPAPSLRSSSLPLSRIPVFSIFLRTPCTLCLARSWLATAVGRWQLSRYRDAWNAGVAWSFPPPALRWARAAVGRSPEPGRLVVSPLGYSGRKRSWACLFPWAGPIVKRKRVFCFSLLFEKKKYFGKCLCIHLCSKNGEINVVVILMTRSRV
jgi:hypothetical protein